MALGAGTGSRQSFPVANSVPKTACLRRRSQGEKAWAQGVDEILEKKEEKEDIRPRPLFCQLGVDDGRQRFSGKSGTEKGALP